MSAPRPVHEPSAAQLGTPAHVDTQAEIAAAITNALTQRMKPRRRPRRDLRLSTALWLLLTGAGIACVLVTLFTTADCSIAALVLGALQVIFGYAWIVSMTAQRDPKRGAACALPPLTFYYLGQWKYGRLRPLRFVVSGLVIAGAALLLPHVMEVTRAWVGANVQPLAPLPPAPTEVSKLQQVRDYRNQKSFDKLIDLLRVLTKTDAILSEDARNRAELAVEMKGLCLHADTGVKIAALAAYARWGDDEAARDLCLDALGRTEEEQLMALQLLPKWKDTDAAPIVAKAIAGLIGRPNRITSQAASALEEIAGPAAESATLDMLLRSREQNAQLVALDILGKVGGQVTVRSLEGYIGTILDQSIKAKARDTIEAIQTRPPKVKK